MTISTNNKECYQLMDHSMEELESLNLASEYSKKKKSRKMIKVLKKTVKKFNNNESCFELGKYYFQIKKYNKMKKYLKKSIRFGNNQAIIMLANFYRDIEKKETKMLKCLQIGLNRNYHFAIFNLGLYYFKKNDYIKMKKYFLLSIEHQNFDAYYYLGYYYAEINYDEILMKKYYKLSTEFTGNINSSYNLGIFYQNQKKFDKMEKYFEISVKNGNGNAMMKLGLYYQSEKNYEKMKNYYCMAILNKYYEGALKMGLYHKYIDIDVKQMLFYFNIAKQQDIDEALFELGDYYDKINSVEIANKYYSKAVQYCNKNAARRVNENLEKKFNIKLALKCYNKLNEKNLHEINNILVNFYEIKHLIGTKNCQNCLKLAEVLKYKCGHEICFKCYKSSTNCRFCL